MARVEWSELSGEEAETVLATLIYSEYPTATRVRPSRGDYGIDVVVPVLDGSSQLDVYQIKKYSRTLTAGQKRDIEESFERLLIGLVERNIAVRGLASVAPTDLAVAPSCGSGVEFVPDSTGRCVFAKTDEKTGAPRLTEDQKAALTAWRNAPDRLIKWEGTPFCTSLASKYGAVIDYYLHGGGGRIRSTVADVQKILRGHLALAGAADVADHDGDGDTVAVDNAERPPGASCS